MADTGTGFCGNYKFNQATFGRALGELKYQLSYPDSKAWDNGYGLRSTLAATQFFYPRRYVLHTQNLPE